MFEPKLTSIVENKLYALVTPDGSDVFTQCFENWQDTLYLYDFFKQHEVALGFYGMGSKEAVKKALSESKQFYLNILDIAEGNTDNATLDNDIFQPLHKNDDFDLPLIAAKAYGPCKPNSFLRLYAVRLSDGTYIIAGGLIKTTQRLQETEEGNKIVAQLKQLEAYLRKNGYEDAFDIGVLIV